jgi:hypothetical protein
LDEGAEKMPSKRYGIMKDLHEAEGKAMYHIACFGDHIAKREGYKSVDGLDAVHYYLVQKHNWLPAQARALNVEDLQFLLHEEMQGWTLPPEAL